MKIAIGCDHIVTDTKDEVATWLKAQGHEVIDVGTYDFVRTHYPIYGHKVGIAVATGQAELGICICGTGVGIANAAQKTKGIRTALVRDVITAKIAREQYNANVISCGGRITGKGLIIEIVNEFINAQYKNENKAIIEKIDQLIEFDNFDLTMFDEEIKKWKEGFYHD